MQLGALVRYPPLFKLASFFTPISTHFLLFLRVSALLDFPGILSLLHLLPGNTLQVRKPSPVVFRNITGDRLPISAVDL